ncbi:MAG: type II toxin-antitoxin system YafQ family toxin [Bacteroidales bacterium]|nr:type II toxin-antitoxin system YafQ family toxin [Bacteroidales bacterium]
MLSIVYTKQFDKDLARIKKRKLPKSELDTVVKLLSENKQLPQKYKDHSLKGKYVGYRECHIQPDWLLIYKKNKKNLILLLLRTGTHSDLF